jgi:uncharacterized protein YoxC
MEKDSNNSTNQVKPKMKYRTVECGAAIGTGEMERFVQSFQQSAKRWEYVVYPALFAFSILAAYGFFLIYSLTSDMGTIARSMDSEMWAHMESMSQNMSELSDQFSIMTKTMTDVSEKLNTLEPMASSMNHMKNSIDGMNGSMRQLAITTENMHVDMNMMRADMSGLNQNISRPLQFFNSYTPW